MFQEKLIILYMREKQMFIYSVVSIQWWKQYYRKKKLSCGAPAWRGGKGKRGKVRGGSYHRFTSQMGHLTSITTSQMSQLPSKKPRTSQTRKPLHEIKTSRLFTGLSKTVKIRRAGSPLFPLSKMLNQQEMHETVLWPRNKISDWKVVYEGLVIVTPSIVPPHLMLHF